MIPQHVKTRNARAAEFDSDMKVFTRRFGLREEQAEVKCSACGCPHEDHAFGGPCGCGKCGSFTKARENA